MYVIKIHINKTLIINSEAWLLKCKVYGAYMILYANS